MENESITKTVESGAFIRTVIRRGPKKKQKTTRIQKNMEKVVLGHIGDFEVYCYPYDYPDKIFLGAFPISTQIEAGQIESLLVLYNKCRWFINGEWQKQPKKSIKAKTLRRHIQTAYNQGLERIRSPKTA